LSGMLRSFTTGYGAGGFDIDKQTLIRNSLVKQRNKERNSLANNAAAVSITWSYFNEGVAGSTLLVGVVCWWSNSLSNLDASHREQGG